MITLIKFNPAFGLPDPSPFCTKVEILLKMAGLAYDTDEGVSPGRGPKGKLPALRDDGATIGDSEIIRWHLERKYGIDFDAGLDAPARARAHAFARMLEERTYWAIAATRWMEDEHFPTTRDAVLAAIPGVIRPLAGWVIRRQLRAAQRAQGMGRHSRAERYDMTARDIQAVSAELGGRAFMMGDETTSLDATVFAFLSGIVDPPFPSPAVDEVRRHANLMAYLPRMKARFFPA